MPPILLGWRHFFYLYPYKDLLNYITMDSPSFTRTTIADSIECHLMGFKAEESRQMNGMPLEISL